MYILVEFTDEQNVAVVPDTWLEGTSCAVWPDSFKGPGQINKAVKEKAVPARNWPSYPIRELYRNESFIEVRKRLRKAEAFSDLATTADEEPEGARKSHRVRRPIIYSDDEEIHKKVARPIDHSDEDEIDERRRKTARRYSSSEDEVESSVPAPPVLDIPHRGNFGQREAATPVHKGAMIARDSRMFSCLEKILQGQAELKKMIGQISLSMPSSLGQDWAIPEGITLPVHTTDDMADVEVKLGDLSTFSSLVNYLSLLGGRNVADGTRKCLTMVITNELAAKYNWNGLKGKLPFGKLRLCSAVQKAVMRSCQATATEFQSKSKEWLRSASDRDGGRARRKDVEPVQEDCLPLQ